MTDAQDLISFDDDGLDEERPARKPRKRWIVLGVLAAVAAMVLIMVSPTMLRVIAQKDATLSMPEKVGQLTRDDSPAAQSTANDLVTALRAAIDLERSEGAVYSDADQTIMLFGGTGLLWNPEQELDTVIKLMQDKEAESLRGLTTVDAGPLGGIMKCVLTDDQEATAMAVCGWADHGSIALAMFPGRTLEEAANLMRELRTASLRR